MPAQTDFELAMPVFERSAVDTLSDVSKCSQLSNLKGFPQ
jgi:hypothetical protein